MVPIKKINGKISNKTEKELKKVRSNGNVKVTLMFLKKVISSRTFMTNVKQKKKTVTNSMFLTNIEIKFFL
tara:strand:- start:23 stop:235 length:213 start_codon:yes stop_codon:yes gene_type:complete